MPIRTAGAPMPVDLTALVVVRIGLLRARRCQQLKHQLLMDQAMLLHTYACTLSWASPQHGGCMQVCWAMSCCRTGCRQGC